LKVRFGSIVLKKSSPTLGPIFQEPLVRLAFWDVGDRFDLSGFIQRPCDIL